MAHEESADPPSGAPPATPGGHDELSKIRHDLRTPINQIIGYSELVLEQAQDDHLDEMASDLEKIGSAARRMLKLLEEAFANPNVVAAMRASQGGEPRAAAAIEEDRAAVLSSLANSQVAEEEETLQDEEKARLLVADDNEMNRDMLSRRLQAHGYEVESAEDGAKTLEAIDNSPFDLLLLDVMMPGLNGIEVLKILRSRKGVADLPVIMATAMDESHMIVEALRLGANDYVTKPLDFPVVLARVKTHLSLKRAKDAVVKMAESLEIRNRFIQQTFGRYLSDEIVQRLLESPEGLALGGEKRTVTIMMSDVRGFTSLSEKLPPEHVVRMLNNYLGQMAVIVQKYQGTIDEFIGDAILAIFGAPIFRSDDAARAVSCAIEMQLAMDHVNQFNRSEGYPEIETGIALNTGEVVVGNIGSETRAKYGVVGSHVNLTSRIESYTVGGQILISEATRDAATGVRVGKELQVQAKGLAKPLRAFDLRGIGDLAMPVVVLDLRELKAPLEVRWKILEGKNIDITSFPGVFVRASQTAGELHCDASVPPLTNLLFQVDADGKNIDVYGKVVDPPEGAKANVFVRFTSVPPEVLKILSDRVVAPA